MKKNFYKFLLAFGFFSTSASTLSAQTCTTDQSYLGSNTLQSAVGSNTTAPDGQSFKAGLSGALNSVSLDISASNPGCLLSTMNVKVDILNGDGINGSVLASQTFSISTNLTRTLYNFNFSSPAVVSATQLYTIIFTLLPGQDCGSGEPQLIWYFNFPTSFWSSTGGRQYQDGVVTSLGNTQYFKTCVGPVAAGAALNFDGTNDFVNIPNNSSFNFGTNDFTVETWAKTTISAGNRVMIGKINGPNNFWLGVAGGKANFSLIGGTDATGTTTISDGNWHHIAAVRQNGVASLYVDGVLEASQNNTGTATINGDLTIGNFNGGYFFPGSLDEVRIWDRALCKGEILNNKNAELASSQTGLVAYYKFNQGVDNSNNSTVITLTDLSVNANNGTLNNFALSGSTSNWFAPGAVTSGSAAPTYTPVSASISSQVNVLCNGYSNGSFDLTPSGGTAPYTFVWSNSFTSEDIAGLAAGIYSVTVTDANMCKGTQTVNITEPAAIVVSVVASSTAICTNEVATVTISATGGTGAYSGVGTYTTNAAANNYTVTDVNSCAATTTLNITVNPLPSVTANSGNVTTCGDVSADFGIVASGNNNTYEWHFDQVGGSDHGVINGTYTEINFNTDTMTIQQVLTGLYAGYYVYCYVTNEFGCVARSANDTIVANLTPTITVNSGTICAGQSFTMVPTGADTYSYSGGSDVVAPSSNATYTVTGTDAATGCENTAISSVTVSTLPSLMAMTTNTLLCTGETATLSVMGASTYTWSTTENTTDIVVTPTVQTTYTVDGTDANGCSNTTTITQDVSLCTGITSLVNDASTNLYPNPNNGLFVIELTTTSKVTVTNALGQVVIVETFDAGKHSVNINNESTGVYFVKVMTNNKQQIIKVIKE